jgi:hypothetical protein
LPQHANAGAGRESQQQQIRSQLLTPPSPAFSIASMRVHVTSPSSSPKRAGATAAQQAAWLGSRKIPQIPSSRSSGMTPSSTQYGSSAALPGFGELRSSKLRLPPLQQGGAVKMPASDDEVAVKAMERAENMLSPASSVHSRRQSLARQKSLKATALVQLSPMARDFSSFSKRP